MRSIVISGLLLAAALPAFSQTSVQASAQTPAPTCDRGCLEKYVDRYLDAMQAHNPSLDLFSRDVKFTENGIRLPFGNEGLWSGMTGKGTYKFYVPDVETQQVAFIGTVREAGKSTDDGRLVALALRLKVEKDRIVEVEQLAIRPDVPLAGQAPAPTRFPPAGEAVEKMAKPHSVYFETIPVNKRASREELIKTANYYFAGLQRNDGKGYYPFTDDCARFENGMQSTKECKKNFEEQVKGIVSRIRDRRFVAVDRERGIVYAFGFFDHERINWTWQLAELFKIENGQIRRIEAVFLRGAYGINSGWSTYEQGMSEEPQIIR
jgi:hypothetical protein